MLASIAYFRKKKKARDKKVKKKIERSRACALSCPTFKVGKKFTVNVPCKESIALTISSDVEGFVSKTFLGRAFMIYNYFHILLLIHVIRRKP